MRLLLFACVILAVPSIAFAASPEIAVPAEETFGITPFDAATHSKVLDRPLIAQRLHQSGRVVLNVLVDRERGIEKIQIATSSGFPLLDAAAVLDAQGWRFADSQESGLHQTWHQVAVDFPAAPNKPIVGTDVWPNDIPLLDPSNNTPDPSHPIIPPKLLQGAGGYPVIARRTDETGAVQLEYVVGPDGWVQNVRVLRSSGYALLDAEALISASKYRFTPATRNGLPIAVRQQSKVAFQLE